MIERLSFISPISSNTTDYVTCYERSESQLPNRLNASLHFEDGLGHYYFRYQVQDINDDQKLIVVAASHLPPLLFKL